VHDSPFFHCRAVSDDSRPAAVLIWFRFGSFIRLTGSDKKGRARFPESRERVQVQPCNCQDGREKRRACNCFRPFYTPPKFVIFFWRLVKETKIRISVQNHLPMKIGLNPWKSFNPNWFY
jgi:hypothetical protein